MTLQKLASAIAFREGKKHQASIGDVREILKIIVMIEVEAGRANNYDASSIYPLQLAVCERALKQRNKRKTK